MHIHVICEDREDGGLRVYSDELPGLVLSHSNRIKVLAAIEPAVRLLLKAKGVEFDSLVIDTMFISDQEGV